MKLSAPILSSSRKRAKRMVRNGDVPLHQALDTIAREVGFARWSLLFGPCVRRSNFADAVVQLKQGDMLLLAGRRGQGKTALGLQLLLDAARLGRKAVFFTLEFTEAEARAHLHVRSGGADKSSDKVEIVTSPEISADYIVRHLSGAGGKCRGDRLPANSRPEAQHAASLRTGREPQCLCETDGDHPRLHLTDRPHLRSGKQALPDIGDLRLPNLVDLGLFDRACFLHNGAAQLQNVV